MQLSASFFWSVAGAVLAVLHGAENEGFAIGALADGGVLLVSADADLVKSTVALTGVVCTLSDSACDTMIVFLFHCKYQTFRKKLINIKHMDLCSRFSMYIFNRKIQCLILRIVEDYSTAQAASSVVLLASVAYRTNYPSVFTFFRFYSRVSFLRSRILCLIDDSSRRGSCICRAFSAR